MDVSYSILNSRMYERLLEIFEGTFFQKGDGDSLTAGLITTSGTITLTTDVQDLATSGHPFANGYITLLYTDDIYSTADDIQLKTLTADKRIILNPTSHVLITSDILPSETKTKNIGSSSYVWNAIYGSLLKQTVNEVLTIGDDTSGSSIKLQTGTGAITLDTTLLDVETDNITDIGTTLKYFKNNYLKNIYCDTLYAKTGDNLNVLCNLIPTDDTYNLGSADNYWDSGYITSIHGTVVDASDRRLKQDIKPLDKSIDFIKNIEPIKFKYIKDNRPAYGMIAQDVEQYDDDNIIVSKPIKNDDYYGIKYMEFIPILINCIKEQQKMIDKQNEKINKLKNLIKHIKE